MKKGFYNESKIRKPILRPKNPDSQMVILETELYKPLINKEIKHSVQQSVNLIRVGVVVEIDTFQSNTAKSLI